MALLAVWREASSHAYCSFGRTVAARSPDGGRSWSAPWVVGFRRSGAWDTGGPENLVQTGDGTLWLGAWARIPEPELGTVGRQRPEMYVLRSHDEGRSWEQLPKLGDGWQFLCTPMLELSNGEFLWLGSVPDPADEGVTSYTSLRRAVFILRRPSEPLIPGTGSSPPSSTAASSEPHSAASGWRTSGRCGARTPSPGGASTRVRATPPTTTPAATTACCTDRPGPTAGAALAFDGVDDHLRVTNCPSLWLGQELTMEAWIRTLHPEREQTIVSRLPTTGSG